MSVQIQAIMLWHIPPGKIFAVGAEHYSLNSQPDASCQCYNTITEWAACGAACAVVWRYAGLRVREVAADGDRFDYWVDDGAREFGLEVSGTTTDDVETRHRTKV